MTEFKINGKVALISGGASGLGFQYALKLLENGAKGVALADVNPEAGAKAIQEIEKLNFAKHRAIFIQTDVTDYEQYENAFKETVNTFKNLDILINNAGILNDAVWQKEIDVNMKGTINGILLGLEKYLPKYKSGAEGVILNISSIAGICPFGFVPVYVGTKFAVHGMTLSWGLPAHYERTKVRVIAICPGVTMTPLITEMANRNLGPAYEEIRLVELEASAPPQSTDQIVPHVMTIIEKAPSGTMWVVEAGEPPYQYKLPDRFEMSKEFLQ